MSIFKKSEQSGLWTASFGEIGASLSVLEKNGFTLDMFKQLREKNGDTVAKKIVALFTADYYQIKVNWYNFYKQYFGIDYDLSDIKISTPKLGLTRPIIIIPGVTPNLTVTKMKDHMDVWTYTENLDKAIVKNDRDAKDGPYLIWVRDGLEPEKDYRNMSANTLAAKNISGQTLLERLIHGFEYWDKTKKHLDYKDITLCSGSRGSGGDVPYVCFYPRVGDRVRVGYYHPGNSRGSLGAREVSC